MKSLCFTISFFVCLSLGTAHAAGLTLGKAQSAVVELTGSNFQGAISDPSNPFWLLKLYAPWCGHCKRLAPVLDKLAPILEGKMAIGKVDCTIEKKLCEEFKARGYPTLKFSYDGEVFDYPGGRSESEIMAFSEKMNRPIVTTVDSVADAWKYLTQEASDLGVIFVAYSPQVTSGDTEESFLTKVYEQVARKQRAFGHFLLLKSSATDLASIPGQSPETPFICRLEENVDTLCFENIDNVSTENLLDFVKANNIPTVNKLGPHNFNKVGRAGRPLVIAAVDSSNDEQVATIKRELIRYATTGPMKSRNKYYYGWLDAKHWSTFLSQFNVDPKDSPQFFVLNVPDKTFWQDASYGKDIDALLTAVDDGTIKPGSSGPKGIQKIIDRIYYLLVHYRPWSVVLVVLVVVAIAVAIASLVSPAGDHEYDEVGEEIKMEPEGNLPGTENTKEESKKDK